MRRVQSSPGQRVEAGHLRGRRVPRLFIFHPLPVEGVVLFRNFEARRRQTSADNSHNLDQFIQSRTVVAVDAN